MIAARSMGSNAAIVGASVIVAGSKEVATLQMR
jgi:hypothetical protein